MSKKNELGGLIVGLVAILATACFFIIGFFTNSWHLTWMIFFIIPISALIVEIVVKEKDIVGSITGLVAVVATAVFLIIGFEFGLWHPGWLIFITIPIVGTITDIVKRKDFSGVIVGLVALLATVTFFIIGSLYHVWHIAWIVFLLIPITAIILNIIKVSQKKDEDDETTQSKL